MHYQCGCIRESDNSTKFRVLCKAHADAANRAASWARDDEREACAKAAEECFGEFGPNVGGVIARKIRKRATK